MMIPTFLNAALVCGLKLSYFPTYWEISSQLTSIFQMDWNHQPVNTVPLYLISCCTILTWEYSDHPFKGCSLTSDTLNKIQPKKWYINGKIWRLRGNRANDTRKCTWHLAHLVSFVSKCWILSHHKNPDNIYIYIIMLDGFWFLWTHFKKISKYEWNHGIKLN